MTQDLAPELPDELAAELIATAHALADTARKAVLPLFRSNELATENKRTEGFDPVTRADRAAERAMRECLAERRPLDGIMGEEFGATEGRSGLTWVLDPIDGTRAFLSGTPTWGVLIAVNGAAGPILGVIDQPYTGERWIGGLGQAQLTGPHGDRTLVARSSRPLCEAILFSTFPEVGSVEERSAFERVASGAQLTRYGTDCYAYGLLAAGQIDLVIEAGLHNYDVCAPIAVIEAAGGIVTNWDGGPAHEGGRVLAAANPEIHAEALARLRG
ncbi:histidinol phosphatase-like enzyme (inositol monophosphatase family) [Aliiruegeria haliotis]|uniref:Histidinol-phosphatase n=1 Tax=Aliiruegeria haliotis TaxID=1280846 RepID=A0A2T0RQX6_9RHOB|nr:histidinol-phosphatase [Aliiruegeria haliotis]PRY23594.1 histidinol phosphatase-like enzyme (inositol monophosphatase family) [Aliiruegeria haliotis]